MGYALKTAESGTLERGTSSFPLILYMIKIFHNKRKKQLKQNTPVRAKKQNRYSE